jgi:hypothetical protein
MSKNSAESDWQRMVCLFSLLLIIVTSECHAQDPFKIYGKFIVDDGKVTGAMIKVEKNGKQVRLEEVTKSRFDYPLEYDCEYIFSYIKDGYITKKVAVSTFVPKEKQSLEFEPFKFDVEIFKQYEGVNTVIYNQPVGKIRFNDVLNEFDYDTDYTKSIQSELAKAEKALKEKQKQERELLEKLEKEKELAQKQKEKEEKVKPQEEKKVVVNETKPPPKPEKEEKIVSTKTGRTEPEKKPEQTGRKEPKFEPGLVGMVTMKSYTSAVYGYPVMDGRYGWINYGDGTGIHEIATKEEYDALAARYLVK